jgi:hypothetical protein
MADSIFGVFIGALFAIGLVWCHDKFNSDSDFNIIRKAKTECEKELPRNVKCVITAVPEVNK